MSIKSTQSEVQDFAKTLQAQRLIKLYIGSNTTPYLVQEANVQKCSDYFTAALRNEHLDHLNAGELSFPDDNFDAWAPLLSYLIHGKLDIDPREEFEEPCAENEADISINQENLVRSWYLGEKYIIPRFQDEVMICLLRSVELGVDPSLASVSHAFLNSLEKSAIRRLLAEEWVLEVIHIRDGRFDMLSPFETIPGFLMEYAAGVHRYHEGEMNKMNRPGHDWAKLMRTQEFRDKYE